MESQWGDVRVTVAVMLICFLSAMVSYRTYFGRQQGYMQLARSLIVRNTKAFKHLGIPLVIISVLVIYYLVPLDAETLGLKVLITTIICGYSFVIAHEIVFRGLLPDRLFFARNRENPKNTEAKVLLLEALTLALFLGTFIPKLLLVLVLIYSRHKTGMCMLEEKYFTDDPDKKYFSVSDSILDTTTIFNFVIISIIVNIVIGR